MLRAEKSQAYEEQAHMAYSHYEDDLLFVKTFELQCEVGSK